MSNLVGNREDLFSHDAAHRITGEALSASTVYYVSSLNMHSKNFPFLLCASKDEQYLIRSIYCTVHLLSNMLDEILTQLAEWRLPQNIKHIFKR